MGKKNLGRELILSVGNCLKCEKFTYEFSKIRPGTFGKKMIVSKEFTVPVDINIIKISSENGSCDLELPQLVETMVMRYSNTVVYQTER